MNDKDIDFVITWVDSNDPAWIKERSKYISDNGMIDESRFRDWGLLKYWFRSVEANANWVRKIHFVTYGHSPKWLNTKHSKLNFVKHSDFIDEKYLPTFNSCAIEMNIHKINDLAEKFVYFNDDMFVNKPVGKDFFFKKDLPCDSLILKPVYPIDNGACKIQNSCMSIINHHFSKYDLSKTKLFSIKNGLYNITNIIQYAYPYIIGLNSKHLPQGYLKTTINEINTKEKNVFDEVSSHKFRQSTDCSQWLFQYWQLASGLFYPCIMSQKGCYQIKDINDAVHIYDDIIHQKNKVICINDNEKTADVDKCQEKIIEAFEQRYPNCSEFELQ